VVIFLRHKVRKYIGNIKHHSFWSYDGMALQKFDDNDGDDACLSHRKTPHI